MWNRDPILRIEDKPLVFVGGHPRSGTTLMRVMLDVHPMIRCGPETHILPLVLKLLDVLDRKNERNRLIKAGLYPKAIHRAFGAFIQTLIQNAGEDAPILCNKDPTTLGYLKQLAEILPSAKFILIVRDGRAVINSLMKRGVTINMEVLSPIEMFERWEKMTLNMLIQCDAVGTSNCLVVRYEDLVLRPTEQMHIILRFINVPWDPVVLKHDENIDRGTVLNALEPSTTQVKYPINTLPLYSWTSNTSSLPIELKTQIHLKSALLNRLNYARYPPDYGKAEEEIAKRSDQLQQNPYFKMAFFDSGR